jgi:tRNA pseudouridine32 synthase/23S rRNA pseudouridine746 synthase
MKKVDLVGQPLQNTFLSIWSNTQFDSPVLPLQSGMLEILFQDTHLLIVNKPAGLLSVPGRGEDKQDCLSARIQQVFTDALVVHRLDMATSGLMVFARGEAMQRELSRMFREREVSKRYVALVKGDLRRSQSEDQDQNQSKIKVKSTPSPALPRWERELRASATDRGLRASAMEREDLRAVVEGWWQIDLPIIVDWPNRPRSKVDYELGKPSLTRYRLLGVESLSSRAKIGASFDTALPTQDERSLVVSRLELEPITGRTHQLRLHLASIGHPIIGDTLYEGRSAERLMLHATRLAFDHPITAQPLYFENDAPF